MSRLDYPIFESMFRIAREQLTDDATAKQLAEQALWTISSDPDLLVSGKIRQSLETVIEDLAHRLPPARRATPSLTIDFLRGGKVVRRLQKTFAREKAEHAAFVGLVHFRADEAAVLSPAGREILRVSWEPSCSQRVCL